MENQRKRKRVKEKGESSPSGVKPGHQHQTTAQFERDGAVGLVFIDTKAKAYLSITAQGEVLRDHTKAAQIWKSTDNVWWRGPDDPAVCVLRVTPINAELWDGPASKALAIFEFAKKKFSNASPLPKRLHS
jgi:general stress protein 26